MAKSHRLTAQPGSKYLGGAIEDPFFDVLRNPSSAVAGPMGEAWKLRQRGLYVDPEGEGWVGPGQVTAKEVAELRAMAKLYVEGALRVVRLTEDSKRHSPVDRL